jgi:DNA polymerase III sliding clamp (beta) subunit (PCNA family)
MRFTATTGTLLAAVKAAQLATPSAPARPEFAGVMLIVGAASCSIVASRNGDTTVSASFPISGSEPGRVLLPPQPLSAYLATFAPEETVRVVFEKDSVTEVSVAGRAAYQLRTIDAELPLPSSPEAAPLAVDFSRLGAALAAVRSAVDENGAVQLVSSNAGLALHATDGYRLARCVLPEAGFGDATFVLPVSSLDWVAKLGVTHITLESNQKTVRFSAPDAVVSTRMLAKAFPAVGPLLEATPPYSARIRTADLIQALTRLRAVALKSPVSVHLEESTMKVAATSQEYGSGEESLELERPADTSFDFHVRPDLLADALHALNADVFDFRWSAALSSIHFSTSDPLAITVLLQPVRAPSSN